MFSSLTKLTYPNAVANSQFIRTSILFAQFEIGSVFFPFMERLNCC